MVLTKEQNTDGESTETISTVSNKKVLSIYDIHTKLKRNLILIILGLFGFLYMFDEIIYVPALSTMIKDFNTTKTLGSATVGVYLFAISVSSLIWGTISDYYRRKLLLTLGLTIFILSTIGGYFSPNIYVFLVCRALQGCTISLALIVGLATIADIFQPDHRGRAYGVFYALYFCAIVCGPIIGGTVAQYFGWRTTLLVVAIISFSLLVIYILIVPETQQYYVICMYQNKHKITLLEADQVSPPKLTNPCQPLFYLGDPEMLPYFFVILWGYVGFNCGLLLASTQMSKVPYSYNESTIGLLYVPLGMGIISGSIIGGKLSDRAAQKSFQGSNILEGRMVPGLILSILRPVGFLIYGWSLRYNVNILVLVLGQVLFTFGEGATRPGVLSYITVKYQQNAAGITAINNFFQQLVTSIVLTFIESILDAMGTGWFFTILAFLNILTTVIGAVTIYRNFRLSKNSERRSLL